MNHPLPDYVLERAAIIEFDGKLPRAEAERLALEAWKAEQKKPLERK
jgi:hypothetical protein